MTIGTRFAIVRINLPLWLFVLLTVAQASYFKLLVISPALFTLGRVAIRHFSGWTLARTHCAFSVFHGRVGGLALTFHVFVRRVAVALGYVVTNGHTRILVCFIGIDAISVILVTITI